MLDKLFKNILTTIALGVERNASLVMVQHCKIETVHIWYIPQLSAGRIAYTRALNLDHIRSEPSKQLCTGGTGLNMCHIQNANTFQCFCHCSELSIGFMG